MGVKFRRVLHQKEKRNMSTQKKEPDRQKRRPTTSVSCTKWTEGNESMCILCFVLCVVVNNTLGQLARRQPAGLFTCLTPESDRDECPRERERESVLLYIVIHVLDSICKMYAIYLFCILYLYVFVVYRFVCYMEWCGMDNSTLSKHFPWICFALFLKSYIDKSLK